MNITMEEQILEFLDGNLSGADEEELLHRLAVSPERRTLLRQHLQVREMVGVLARKQKLAVPGALTAGVFASVASLGYSGPIPPASSAQPAGLKPPVQSPARTGLRKRTIALLSLACLLLGSGVTYLLGNSTEQSGSVAAVSTQQFNTTTSSAPSNAASNNIASNNGAPAVTTTSENPVAHSSNHSTVVSTSHKNRNTVKDVASSNNSALVGFDNVSTQTPPAPAPEVKEPVAVQNNTNSQNVVNPSVEPKNEPATDIREPANTVSQRPSSPFDRKDEERKTFTQPYSFSVRSGGGKMPGSSYGYTGSLFEIRGTYHLNNWLSMTGSYGQFMPYETGVVSAQIATNDRTQQLKYSSDIQYKNVLGMELGARFAIEEIPFELAAGAMNDLQGTWIPRGSLFTSLDWSENLQLKVGIEGMFYTHKINFSNSQTQPSFLLGSVRKQETAGFVGPAIELMWKF